MLFAGFRSVIATLWYVTVLLRYHLIKPVARSIEDADGPVIARTGYEALFSGGSEHLDPDDVPYALDDAVQQLRKMHPDPSRWAPYIHIGL